MESIQNKSLLGFKIWRRWCLRAQKSKSHIRMIFCFFGCPPEYWIFEITNRGGRNKEKKKEKKKEIEE